MHKLTKLLIASVFMLGSVASAQTNRISISTGGTGGVYYPLGGGMANILSKYVTGLQATAEVTGGSVDNLKLIVPASLRSGSRWPTAAGMRSMVSTSSRTTRSMRVP